MGELRLDGLLDEPVGWPCKGWPPGAAGLPLRALGAKGWNLLAGDLDFPVLVLHERALAGNLAVMARWCEDHGVSLAPHGKTTMAPQLVDRQLRAGAWAVTVASVGQAAVLRRFGAGRVLLANQLVAPAGLRWAAAEQAADPGFELSFLVDSERGVALADQVLGSMRPARPLGVLVELGAPGSRAGCRSEAEALAVAGAVARSPWLELAGVEAFEGLLGPDRGPATVATVDRLLGRVAGLAARLDQADAFAGRDEVVLSAGGSAFFDRVVEILAPAAAALGRPARVVLRSGCYLTHDHGLYERLSPLGAELRPALELWGEVLSRPEPGLAVLGFGRRDAPFDAGLPVPLRVAARGGPARPLGAGPRVTALNDQHAMVAVAGVGLAVGDLVGCGVAHPCTAFDKWRLIPVVDEDYQVTDAIRTFF
jgi:D-serine deaminase-like pyridoxal phosphate-dependent protein